MINNVTSIIVTELKFFQYWIGLVLNIEDKLKLEVFGSKKTVASADCSPPNIFLLLRNLNQEAKELNFHQFFCQKHKKFYPVCHKLKALLYTVFFYKIKGIGDKSELGNYSYSIVFKNKSFSPCALCAPW